MKKIEIPAFGEARFEAHVTDRKNVVYTLSDAEETLFDSYAELFVRHGFTMRERRERENYRYAAYFDGTDAYFLNYYAGVKELMVIAERETAYFSYSDQAGEAVCTPQVTQVKLEDYGMSYAIRLSDRRFIVIDGGWAMKDACDNLYECLTEDTNGEKPVIAAWILTQLSYFESGEDTSGIPRASATWHIVCGSGLALCTTTHIAPTIFAVRIA